MSEENLNNTENLEKNGEKKENQDYEIKDFVSENKNPIVRKTNYINVQNQDKHLDLKMYNELDDFASEVLEGEKLVDYVQARREYLFEPEETVKKYFEENEIEDKIETFSDFYYQYLIKYTNNYFYKFMAKSFTDGFRNLIQKNGIDPDTLNIDWENIRSKELEYEESLVDILYSLINYELKHHGYGIFGINMGYESTLYFIVTESAFLRIDKEPQLFTIFDIGFLETIYNEIYEVTGNIGVEGVDKGDFLEKRGNEYYTLFLDSSRNVVVENIDENDESKVQIVL